jgi:CDP-diacylglycerol---glycerol-3-phosphate 3-phosphatidyltransferase
MKSLWEWIKRGYLRLIDPVAEYLIRARVNPNVITTTGTICTVGAAVVYGSGHIMTAGWIVGLTAIFDVLDGTVARRTGRCTVFGAFYDSTLDRLADGALMAGLTYFYAFNETHRNPIMAVVCMAGIIGSFLISYTRARAEALGVDAKVGVMQRPERVVLLSAPQAFFGLALNGWVLALIIVVLTVTAWITAVQRILFVKAATRHMDMPPNLTIVETAPPAQQAPAVTAPRRAQS